MSQTPIMQITLYNADNEPVRNFSQSIVPWGLLKKAVRLSKSLNMENLTEDDVDALAELVVATFGNKFTVDELNAGADLEEMTVVLQTIVSKASRAMGTGNPTRPAS